MTIGDGFNLWLGRALAETAIGACIVLALVFAVFVWAAALTLREKLRRAAKRREAK